MQETFRGRRVIRVTLTAIAIATLAVRATAALAFTATVVTPVHMRAGPAIEYPAVGRLRPGARRRAWAGRCWVASRATAGATYRRDRTAAGSPRSTCRCPLRAASWSSPATASRSGYRSSPSVSTPTGRPGTADVPGTRRGLTTTTTGIATRTGGRRHHRGPDRRRVPRRRCGPRRVMRRRRRVLPPADPLTVRASHHRAAANRRARAGPRAANRRARADRRATNRQETDPLPAVAHPRAPGRRRPRIKDPELNGVGCRARRHRAIASPVCAHRAARRGTDDQLRRPRHDLDGLTAHQERIQTR